MVNISKVQVGNIFSEISYFKLIEKGTHSSILEHFGTKKQVSIGNTYIEDYLSSADIYDKEVTVGLENKFYTQKQLDDLKKKGEDISNLKVGDLKQLGIKSIWENLSSSQVFTVCFRKKDTILSTKKIEELREAQIKSALEEIEKTSKAKKGVLEKAKEILIQVQQNPIHEVVEGEERVLRGYKIQFKSEDGFYSVCDMDVTDKNNSRQVNINSIVYLVISGIKYIVE